MIVEIFKVLTVALFSVTAFFVGSIAFGWIFNGTFFSRDVLSLIQTLVGFVTAGIVFKAVRWLLDNAY